MAAHGTARYTLPIGRNGKQANLSGVEYLQQGQAFTSEGNNTETFIAKIVSIGRKNLLDLNCDPGKAPYTAFSQPHIPKGIHARCIQIPTFL